MSSSSLRLDRKGRFNRPRTCGVAFALPRESRLGGKIAQGLAVCQPLLIARIGKGRLFSIVELVTVPLDDPRAFFKTAIAFRSDAGGAGFRRVVRGDAGGFGGGCLVFEPGLFRFPCGNERGHVFRVIPPQSTGGSCRQGTPCAPPHCATGRHGGFPVPQSQIAEPLLRL